MPINKPKELILEQILLGPLENFIYFIGNTETKEIAIVDPAWDINSLFKRIDKEGYTVSAILLTHTHPDHINGFDEVVKRYPVPAYVSEHETGTYGEIPNYQYMNKVHDGEIISVAGIDIKCIHAPGHSEGCQLFVYKNICIAGDSVFVDGIGRADLPGGNPYTMYNTIHNVLLKLPDNTILFPGHNYGQTQFSTIAQQKITNPYLQDCSIDEFISIRMGLDI